MSDTDDDEEEAIDGPQDGGSGDLDITDSEEEMDGLDDVNGTTAAEFASLCADLKEELELGLRKLVDGIHLGTDAAREHDR